MKAFVKEKNVPNLLFAGSAGTGKTSMALAVAHELYGKNWHQNILSLNASDERGIDIIRGKVKDFARTKPFGDVNFRIVLLDEADALTQEAQQALRRTMESFTSVSRFILIGNFSSKIIEPIQSRCAVFRFKTLNESDIKKFIARIVEGEKLKISDEAINAVIYLSEGDLRKVANLLQTAAVLSEKITEDVVYDVASQAKPDDVKNMLQAAIRGKFEEARKMLQNMLLRQGLAGSDVIREIHRQIYSLDLTEEEKVQLIEKTGEYEFRLSEGSSDLIQLEALLAQFLLLKKK
jgi:replication factor C small subunit